MEVGVRAWNALKVINPEKSVLKSPESLRKEAKMRLQHCVQLEGVSMLCHLGWLRKSYSPSVNHFYRRWSMNAWITFSKSNDENDLIFEAISSISKYINSIIKVRWWSKIISGTRLKGGCQVIKCILKNWCQHIEMELGLRLWRTGSFNEVSNPCKLVFLIYRHERTHWSVWTI